MAEKNCKQKEYIVVNSDSVVLETKVLEDAVKLATKWAKESPGDVYYIFQAVKSFCVSDVTETVYQT
jgi:hypothetical protein